jgi:micrococcal nuclease
MVAELNGGRLGVAVAVAAVLTLAGVACTTESGSDRGLTQQDSPARNRPNEGRPTEDGGTTEPGREVAKDGASQEATVARVVDGDTILLGDGRRVRLIGIDTPESVDPRRPVECLGKEAAAHTASLLPAGTPVRLELDVEPEDRYGRTLAYVHRRDDGLFVNVAIARDGFAQQLTVPPNVRHADTIGKAVAEARAAGRGLWGEACEVDGCDPAYPTVCIPPGPPIGRDLDCGDVDHRRFEVRSPDPHNFDGDGNGLGCER